jgi:hypothetical protein
MGCTNHTWIYTTVASTLDRHDSSAPPHLSSTLMPETHFPFLLASLFRYLKMKNKK